MTEWVGFSMKSPRLYPGLDLQQKLLFVFLPLLFILVLFASSAIADGFPPYWNNSNGAVHFQPAAWPTEPANPADCGHTCMDWKPYTRFQREMADPRVQDPSNGGTSPQNYVNIASSCIDKTLPSIYYYLYKHPTDSTKDVIMFRWRVEQIANNYATGPSAGNYGATDPWSSALWTVLFDVDGDGYRDLAAHLDGSSGAPSTAIDRIFGIWGNIPTQSLDYTADPVNIHVIAHNPTGFVGTNKLLNFHDSLSPDENWPSGSSTNSWDYGTTRSKLISTNSCNEYFVDYQIPVAMLDASGMGGPEITRDTPISMLFCTANSLNNPFQKDCAINKKWVGDAARPAPFGDYLSFNETAPYQQPIVSSVTATAPTGCPGNYTFTAKVQDTIAIVNGTAVVTVKAVDFYYYYDTDGDGNADDGNTWTLAASATLKPGSLNIWTATWNATSLPKGKYLIGVQAVDAEYLDNNTNNIYDAGDVSLLDDGMTPTENHNRTFSYLTQTEVDALTPPANETWFANPDITGTQMAVIGVAINNCGLAPTLVKTASASSVIAGDTVDFTLTITNLLSTTLTVNELVDVLPAGFSYVNGSTTGDFGTANPSTNGQTLTWTFGPPVNINAGNSASLTFRATATLVSGNYTNSSSAKTGFGDITGNPLPIAVDSARLSLSKTPNKYIVDPGGTVTYILAYSNDSSVTVTNASISDTLPANVNCTSYSVNGGASQPCSGQSVTIPLGDITGGASGNVTLVATVGSGYGSPALLNTATISGTAPDGSTVSKTATSTIAVNVPVPAFTLIKTGPVQIAPSGSVTWTITYKNYGTGSASGVTITDILPAGFTYSSCTGGSSCSGSGGSASWTIGTVAAAASGSVTVTANVAAAPFTYDNPAVNSANITWTGNSIGVPAIALVGITGQACSGVYYFHNGFTATTTAPTSGTDTSTIINTSGNSIMFIAPPATSSMALAGKSLSVDFYLDARAGNITLATELQDYNPGTSTYTVIASNSQTLANQYQWFNYTVTIPGGTPNLAVGHQLRWKFTGSWSGNKNITFYYDGPHNSRSSFCVASSPAYLTISKIVDQPNIAAGSTPTLNYLIGYANTGGAGATNVNLSDTLPSNVNCYRYSSSCTNWADTGTCSGWTSCSGGSVTMISNGTVAAGATGNILLQANVQSGASGTLTNTATISGTGIGSASATANTIVGALSGGGSPSLAVSLSTDKTTANPGDTVTYSITAVNVGSGDATGVIVSDAYPTQDTNSNSVTGFYTYGTCSNSCTNSSGTLSWNAGTLTPGQSVTYTYTMIVGNSGIPAGATIIPDTAQAYAGNITAGSPGSLTNPAQSNQVNVTLNGNPILSLAKIANPSVGLKPGDTITYTLTVTNTGSSTAENVVLTDPIPGHTSYKEITQGNGSFDSVNNRVVFNVGTLISGSSTILIFSVTVGSLSSGSTTIDNSAVVTASNASSRTASAGASASASPTFTLSKTGPAQVAYPAATLTANVSNSAMLFLNDSTQFTEGQYISLNSATLQIISISGNTITVDVPVNASTGDDIIAGITYNITYQNTGNATATGVALTDTLPAGAVFVTATGGGSESSGVVTWNLGNIDPGSGGTVQVVIIPGNTGTITDNASIDCANCAAPVNASASTSVGGLRVSKSTTTPTTPAPGTVTYTIEIENTLGSSANNVTITDVLPSGFTYASTISILIDGAPVAATTSPVVGDNSLTWYSDLFDIPAGKKLVLTFTADVAGTVGPATYQNDSGATSSNASVTPFDPLLTTEEDVTVLAEGTGVIEGYVFRDNDNNGAFNPAVDTPLPGVDVNITDSTSTLYIIATDSYGYFRRVVASGDANVDVDDTDIPAGLELGNDFVDPETVNVPEGSSVTRNTGYVPISTSVDLSIIKTDGATSAVPGNGITYTITVTNNGPANATGATVTDTMPASLTGVTWTCSASSGSSCTGSGSGDINDTVDILSGGTLTYTVNATVSASATGSLSNTATVSPPTEVLDPDTDNNSSTDNDNLTPQANLSITKTDSDDPVTAGNSLTYTITVNNAGPSDAAKVVVTDTLPSGVTFVSTSGCTEDASGVPTCSLGTITAGNSKQYTVTVNVNASTTGPLTNNVSVSSDTNDPDIDNNSVSENTAVNARANLSITKTDSIDPVTAGNSLTYTITVNNAGPSDAAKVVVTDTLPSGVTFVSTSGCTEDASGVPTCSLGTITAGNSKQYTVTVTVNASTTGTLTNNVSVASDTSDPTPNNNSASENTTVNTLADLAITKTSNDMTPDVNDTVVFTLTVTNNGPSNATGVKVTDILPSGVAYVSHTAGRNYDDNTGIWDIGTLNAGASISIDITVTVNQSGRIVNVASITDTDVPDPDKTNNSSGVILNSGGNEADLAVIKEVNNPSPTTGTNIVYTITVTNNGPDNATNVTLTDGLPSGLTYISDNGSGNYNSGTGVWTIGDLDVGSSVSLQITARVDDTGEIINTAGITASDQTDPDITNNRSSAVINQTHTTIADLAVQKTVNQSTVPYGGNATFTVIVRNNGPDDATNVVINDALPSGMNYASSNPSQGSYDDNTGQWTVGTMPAYSYVLLDLVAQMDDVNPQTNTASVGLSDAYDPDPANNTDYATVSAIAADLAINKTDGAGVTSSVPGNSITYAITVTNNGPSDVTGATVADTFPATLSNISWTCSASSGSSCMASGNGDISDTVNILSSGTLTYTVNATVSASATGSLSNTATVTASSGTPDPDENNNSSTDTDSLTPTADLAITKTGEPDPVIAGHNLTYTITVTNNGPSDVTGATVADTFPATLSNISWICSASSGSTCSASGNGDINDTVNILSGGTLTYTVTAKVSASASGSLSNTATVSAPSDTTDPTPDNNTSTEDITVNAPNVFDPPSGSKTVNDAGYPELVWRMVWINNGTAPAERQRIIDVIPANTVYINDSLYCDERGASVRITCLYDAVNNRIIWEGNIAPDTGASNETEAANEVVITYRTTVDENVMNVLNQGFAYWDENGDGSVEDDINRGQTPVNTDDPATTDSGDPTVWNYNGPYTIPAINNWGAVLLFILMLIGAVLNMKKRKKGLA